MGGGGKRREKWSMMCSVTAIDVCTMAVTSRNKPVPGMAYESELAKSTKRRSESSRALEYVVEDEIRQLAVRPPTGCRPPPCAAALACERWRGLSRWAAEVAMAPMRRMPLHACAQAS